MDHKQEFLEIVAKYCDKEPSEITEDMRFREDLGFNSLSFMTYLGDLEVRRKPSVLRRSVKLWII